MGISINIVEAQNDLNTILEQAQEMKASFPAGTYMNEGLGKIIGTVKERLARWNQLEEEENEMGIIDMEVDIQDEDFFAAGGE
jgi:hypothetical protein